ncbi:MAG: hypothetical protein DHS20C08_15980 [Rhodomicrobium sp.]|nr:MAG: hypothetical protein DHS20C08_15980 [Rhodomicrobium sp.]
MTGTDTAVTKLMSATPREFYRSLKALAPELPISDEQREFKLPTGAGSAAGSAVISYTVLPPRQVTGVLSLPQMKVMIEFDGAENEERQQFMRAFDLAFRRGGG